MAQRCSVRCNRPAGRHLAAEERVPIPGSVVIPRLGARQLPIADLTQNLTLTILLRRGASNNAACEEELLAGTYSSGRASAAAALAADPSDLAHVVSFAERYGLKIVDQDSGARRIRAEGSISQIESAFGVQLSSSEDAQGARYVTYSGPISVPSTIAPMVTAVLGLDSHPVAGPRT